jgi:hypothetical protein
MVNNGDYSWEICVFDTSDDWLWVMAIYVTSDF